MKNNIIYSTTIGVVSLCLSLTVLAVNNDELKGLYETGTIKAVDIQNKTIEVGNQVYGLVDGIIVLSNENQLLNQLALMPGEQIVFSLAPQPLDKATNSPLPDQVITKVRILSGYKDDIKR
ncbi:MAG: hypothetical protein JSR17_10655 [Proteobacteria bacterium]|nr:hypothetical protein [Pseudomonadota bacterium]